MKFASLILKSIPQSKPHQYETLLSSIENPRDFLRSQVSQQRKKLTLKTQADYLKKVRRLETLRGIDGTPPDITSISGTSKTYYAYRAAFVWDAIQRGKSAMKARDKAQSLGDTDAARQHMKTIKQCSVDLYVYSCGDGLSTLQKQKLAFLGLDDEPPTSSFKVAKLENRTPKAKPSGKKKDAHVINKIPGWRTLLFTRLEKISSPWLDHAAVCSLTGCRPAELNGSTVTYTNGKLVITIIGAKTNDGHGQATRTITVGNTPKTPEFAHLVKKSPFTVTLHHQVKDYPNAFTKALERAGKMAFPPKTPLMGAYVYRHAMAADMKADSASTEQIAFVLGHSSTRTQRSYGHARGGLPNNRMVMAIGSQPLKTITAVAEKTQLYQPPIYTSPDFSI